MACNCEGTCGCVLTGDVGVTITGNGSSAAPFQISVDATATESIWAGTSADGSLTVTPGGVNGHTPDLAARIDPDIDNALTLTGFGLFVDASGFGGGSTLRTWRVIAADDTIAPGDDFILGDTTGGDVDISLPAAPVDGASYTVKWWSGGNTLRVLGNGNNIDLSGSPITLDVPLMTLNFAWYNAGTSWVVH